MLFRTKKESTEKDWALLVASNASNDPGKCNTTLVTIDIIDDEKIIGIALQTTKVIKKGEEILWDYPVPIDDDGNYSQRIQVLDKNNETIQTRARQNNKQADKRNLSSPEDEIIKIKRNEWFIYNM